MRLALAFVMFGVSPSWSGELTITGCKAISASIEFVECQIENGLDFAVSAVSYSSLVATEGRTIPWLDTRDTKLSTERFAVIDGGLEPSETINYIIRLGNVPIRASEFEITYDVLPTNVKNAAGEVISLDQTPR